jgi:hypothetical protein
MDNEKARSFAVRDDGIVEGGLTKSIKVFNIDVAKTEAEKSADFERWKQTSKEPSWLWDTWRDMLRRPRPPVINTSNIMSIQVKNLLQYTIALVDGNPHNDTVDKDVWLQYDRDLRVMDKSFREYRVPRDEKFRLVGLHLWLRQHGGANVPGARLFRTMLELTEQAGDATELETEVSLWHAGRFTATSRCPLPCLPDHRIMLTTPEPLDPLIREINRNNRWYLQNESMLYAPSGTFTASLVQPAKIQWPEVGAVTDRLAMQIQAHTGARFTATTLVSDLLQLDLLDRWQIMKLLPATAPITARFLAQLEERASAWKQVLEHRFKSQGLTLDKTLRDLLAAEMHPGRMFRDLSAKDQAAVLKQIEHRHAKKENPELRKLIGSIHRAFNSTITDTFEIQKVADQLRRMKRDKDDWLTLDGQNTSVLPGRLCPHYGFLVAETLRAHKNALGQIDTQTVTQSCVKRFASSTPVNFKYYCSKCGELLMTEDLDEYISFNQSIISGTQDKDPIWAYILSECNQVVRRIKFSKPHNVRPFVLAIAQTLESEMISQQAELQRSKTKSLEDIRSIMTVIINTFCFALVSKMIIDHPTRLRWNVATGGKVQRQAEAAKVLNLAYNMIVDSNQNRISKIKDFSIDQIKPILLRAYEWARNVKFAAEESTDETTSDWGTAMINDPWYNLIYEMASSHGSVGHTDFAKLLGERDPLVALCSAKPFAKAYRPPGKTLSPREENYISLLDYVDSGAYREFAVPKSPLLIAWWKKWEHLRVADDSEAWALQLRPTRPSTFRGQVPTFEKIDVSMVRCPTGELHNFSMLVFKHGAKTARAEIAEIKKSGRAPDGVLHDSLCTRCGRSKYARADPKVRGQIAQEVDKQNFLRYFANRCPAKSGATLDGDIHEFPLDKRGFISGACRRCAYQTEFDSRGEDAWWRKWRNTKMGERPAPISLEPDRKLWVPRRGQDKWNVTLASVMQISNISAIPYNIWINLGLSEHRNFQQLRQGKINPQSTMDDRTAEARLIKLVNWVRWVHKQYMLVRHHARMVVPLGLKVVLEAEPQHDGAQMPDILKDFNSTLENFSQTQNARVTCNYVLHTLCITMLQIRSLPIKKLAHRLFDYLVTQIIQGESMMSELEIAKMQTAATSEHEDAPDIDDDDYIEAQEEKDVMDRGTEDPFSLEGADIDTSNTGRDDEEFMD